MTVKAYLKTLLVIVLLALISACEATVVQVIPTARPTNTPDPTTTVTPTTGLDVTRTATATRTAAMPTGGPSPTPLFGPTRTPSGDLTPTRSVNPNAPRIEFFRSDQDVVSPGDSLTLFWSTRGVNSAQIYRLDNQGNRTLVYNIEPDGSETVRTNSRDRGWVEYVLIVGEGAEQVQESLVIPLECPIAWFFQPAPDACPNAEADETFLVEQPFERGRMIYRSDNDRIYVLFNDDLEPAWASYENRYDPSIHPERNEEFDQALVGTGFVQAVGRLGFLWRGNDLVRRRLGNALTPEISFDGSVQVAPISGGDSLFVTTGNGTVIQLLPRGESWQIITPS